MFGKPFSILTLFFVGLGFALYHFFAPGNPGDFESIILDFRESLNPTELVTQLEDLAERSHHRPTLNSEYSEADHIYIVPGDRQLLKALRHSPLAKTTEYIEPNYRYHHFGVPNDPEYHQQWNFRNVNIEGAWRETQGEGITVAVLDTGVSVVPDLEETEFVPGYDFVNDRPEAEDDVGHGTHVAGTIAQSTNNNYGVAGIAHKAKIMPIKVLGTGGGTIADIAEGIRLAADQGADIINLSLGGSGDSQLLREAIAHAHQQGVFLVAAAGNANANGASYPARYPQVFSVSALDAAGKKTPYSNFGAGVDLAAPGGSESGKILQETIDPQTGRPRFLGLQGTSMAAPHVAGTAALVKAVGIDDPEVIAQVLRQSARVVQEDPLNHYGAGQLDAGSAVQLALKGQITVKDFFLWLRDNGYLNPRFWIDGGAVALGPKLAMVLGSYLLAWFLRNYLPFSRLALHGGLIWGSGGFFLLQGFYVFDLPQWPFRFLGSALPEWGNVIQGSGALNPIFASALIPLLLLGFGGGAIAGRWFGVGVCLGVAACLMVSAVVDPQLWLLGSGAIARGFLLVNGLFCVYLAHLNSKPATEF